MFGTPKMTKHWVILAILAILGVPKKGTLGCPNQNSKIIFFRPSTPRKPRIYSRHLRNPNWTSKSDFWPFYWFYPGLKFLRTLGPVYDWETSIHSCPLLETPFTAEINSALFNVHANLDSEWNIFLRDTAYGDWRHSGRLLLGIRKLVFPLFAQK